MRAVGRDGGVDVLTRTSQYVDHGLRGQARHLPRISAVERGVIEGGRDQLTELRGLVNVRPHGFLAHMRSMFRATEIKRILSGACNATAIHPAVTSINMKYLALQFEMMRVITSSAP
jgi:hypothetical protein